MITTAEFELEQGEMEIRWSKRAASFLAGQEDVVRKLVDDKQWEILAGFVLAACTGNAR